jgi:hypothetical protein
VVAEWSPINRNLRGRWAKTLRIIGNSLVPPLRFGSARAHTIDWAGRGDRRVLPPLILLSGQGEVVVVVVYEC